MLKGKRVWIEDVSFLNILYPTHQPLPEIPLFQNKPFILVGGSTDPFDRYPDCIWLSRNAEYNLEFTDTLKDVVNSIKRVPKKYDFIWDKPKEDIWKFIKEYLFLGYSITYSDEKEKSSYNLFKALSKTNREIYQTLVGIDDPVNVTISALLTILIKMQSRDEFVGVVSRYYMRDLTSASRRLHNIKTKFVRYIVSEQDRSDLLFLLFSLKDKGG